MSLNSNASTASPNLPTTLTHTATIVTILLLRGSGLEIGSRGIVNILLILLLHLLLVLVKLEG